MVDIIRPVGNHLCIVGCKQFFEEFDDLFSKDAKTRKQYQKWLDVQFTLLEQSGIPAILQLKHFEKLSGINEDFELYSLRKPKSTGNPRLLFSSVTDEDGDTYIFLLAFKELHKDYDRYIKVAIERMKILLSLLEGEDDEL